MTIHPPLEELAARWAPLTEALISHLFGLLRSQNLFPQDFLLLNRAVSSHRGSVFDRMHPTVQLDARAEHRLRRMDVSERTRLLTTNWALEELALLLNLGKEAFPRSSFGDLQKRGIVDSMAHGRPEPQSIARLFLYYSIVYKMFAQDRDPAVAFPANLDILPRRLDSAEKRLSCFVLEAPEMAARLCKLPLEETFPPGEEAPNSDFFLYFSPWSGFSWNQRWVGVGSLGAISCGYLQRHDPGTLDADFVERFLQIWRPSLLDERPVFSDHSHHGNRFQEFEMPTFFLRVALWKIFETHCLFLLTKNQGLSKEG